MWDVLSRVTDVAYRTVAMTGLAAGTEQPPYPCSLPLQHLENASDAKRVAEIIESTVKAADDMFHNDAELKWQQLDYTDPEKGGDLRLYTRPRIGAFHFVQATLTFVNIPTQKVLDVMHSDDGRGRKRYSANLSHFEVVARPTETANIELHRYWAPPPVAGREFVFLTERRFKEEEKIQYVYGCTIDYEPYKKVTDGFVRAACLWSWELKSVGSNTVARYVSCMNPRGWTPSFMVGWVKAEIAKELIACRRVIYGQSVTVQRVTLQGAGLADDLEKLTDEEKLKMSQGDA
ncbi:hypothetical protein ERJ75_001348100 [Trypanosoma vivax]|uniref:START domain-containing protein n=1 Tax=Trypanosoma vivax (strain Y486) TaxID=1055687 RepID=G0U5S1_TRYVY|nr:hypothetical protein TRVL_02832 [Trypanosoma vivax]KAH8608088.1 hypothetical protein ERJ75_001348100 [Trypanosoma vivax]CCC51222.1 conserved hypothetical protein [Trypanosoma vivax Y486]